jgi:membrane protease YdiL (CAAX protease family)
METTQLILKYFICFGGFFVLSWLAKTNDGIKLLDEKGLVRQKGVLIGLQMGGILWLGFVPYFIFKQSTLEILSGTTTLTIPGLILFSVLTLATIAVALMQSKKDIAQLQTRGIPGEWLPVSFVVKYSVVRFVFLCGYEMFFRGYLLMDCLQYFGVTIAILINIALYVLIHFFSGKKEMIGSVPFGLVLCGLAILFKAVWPAIILHLALSFTYEISSLNKIKKTLKPVV